MTDAKPARSPAVVIAAIVVVLLPILYVLSYGPAILLIRLGLIEYPYTLVNWFYSPLDYLCRLYPPFSQLLHWYAQLWGAA